MSYVEEQNVMLFQTYSHACNYWDKRLVIAGCLARAWCGAETATAPATARQPRPTAGCCSKNQLRRHQPGWASSSTGSCTTSVGFQSFSHWKLFPIGAFSVSHLAPLGLAVASPKELIVKLQIFGPVCESAFCDSGCCCVLNDGNFISGAPELLVHCRVLILCPW